jgi:hypothetical protein
VSERCTDLSLPAIPFPNMRFPASPKTVTPNAAKHDGAEQRGAFHPQLKPIGYTWSYLACRIGHLVPIWQPINKILISIVVMLARPVSERDASSRAPGSTHLRA